MLQLQTQKKPRVWIYFHPSSQVPGIWVDYDAPVLNNPHDMEFLHQMKCIYQSNGCIVPERWHAHHIYRRSIRALVMQNCLQKCMTRKRGTAQDDFGAECFNYPPVCPAHTKFLTPIPAVEVIQHAMGYSHIAGTAALKALTV